MERVVITGIGLVTPSGIGTEETWESLLAGRSAAAPITQFEITDEYPSRFACEVKDWDPTRFVQRKKLKEMGRFITFSLAATQLALDNSGIELTEEDRRRAGCFIGVGLGGLEVLERCVLTLEHKGPRKISPYFIPSLIANLAAGQVTIEHGLQGPSYCHTSACSSSAHALGEAYNWIRYGRTDLMIAGGAEATITPIGISGFSAMFALSRRNDAPEAASRPFDKGRDGFVCGEGAGTFVLESLTRAKARGANIIAELTGFGASSDAYHITRPSKDGEGPIRAMQMALDDAELPADAIDYVNAHGTSTPAGDIEEAKAIGRVFGSRATEGELAVSSTKSMMGHLLGAAGAVEAGICALALSRGVIPPTINLDEQDPECRLDVVPNEARERALRHAISNSFGFGGTNCTLVLSRFRD